MYIAAQILKHFYLHLVLGPHNYLLTQAGKAINLALQKKADFER